MTEAIVGGLFVLIPALAGFVFVLGKRDARLDSHDGDIEDHEERLRSVEELKDRLDERTARIVADLDYIRRRMDER